MTETELSSKTMSSIKYTTDNEKVETNIFTIS